MKPIEGETYLERRMRIERIAGEVNFWMAVGGVLIVAIIVTHFVIKYW